MRDLDPKVELKGKTIGYLRWQPLFLAIFDPRSLIVKSVFDCRLSGVRSCTIGHVVQAENDSGNGFYDS